jgi:hypothetical protein
VKFVDSITINNHPLLLRVFVVLEDGNRFEFTHHARGKGVEVYDHPKRWGGIPRFVGYLPEEQVTKLREIVVRTLDELVGRFEYFGPIAQAMNEGAARPYAGVYPIRTIQTKERARR